MDGFNMGRIPGAAAFVFKAPNAGIIMKTPDARPHPEKQDKKTDG